MTREPSKSGKAQTRSSLGLHAGARSLGTAASIACGWEEGRRCFYGIASTPPSKFPGAKGRGWIAWGAAVRGRCARTPGAAGYHLPGLFSLAHATQVAIRVPPHYPRSRLRTRRPKGTRFAASSRYLNR